MYWHFVRFRLPSSVVLYGCTTHCLSINPDDKHLHCFHLGVIIKKAARNSHIMCFHFSWVKMWKCKLLILKETARQCSKAVVPHDIPTLTVAPHPGHDGGLQGGGRGRASRAGEEYLITDSV